MSRADELCRKYPTIPRDFLIEWDVRTLGINYAETVEKLSCHDRRQVCRSRALGVSLEDSAKGRPQTTRQAPVIRRPHMYLRRGLGTRVSRSSQSPYELRDEGTDKYAIYEGEERIEEVFFPCPKLWGDIPEREPRTSKGTPVTRLVSLHGSCFGISPMYHCGFFDTGDQCKFCSYEARHQSEDRSNHWRSIKVNLEETIEAYRIIALEAPRLIEGRVIMDGFNSGDAEAKLYLQFVERIANSTSYLPNIGLSAQPMSRKNMRRLKDAGLGSIDMNMEVWDPAIFAEACPGKARNRGRERCLEAFQDAVAVLGWGHVGTKMLGGLSLIPENGHKTWQEARDSQAEGIRWLIQRGTFPFYETLTLETGSAYGGNPANRAKLPPTELYVDLALAHHEACREYGMYERMNKLLFCPLDCGHEGYVGQLGMIELAGDIGSWADSVFPGDANWLRRFMEKHDGPETGTR